MNLIDLYQVLYYYLSYLKLSWESQIYELFTKSSIENDKDLSFYLKFLYENTIYYKRYYKFYFNLGPKNRCINLK
jgi:hypothetical protein